jgi:hypothetical protein
MLKKPKITDVGRRPWSRTLSCPDCHGTSFDPRRSVTGRIITTATLGLGALFTPKSRVRCDTCGRSFERR